MFFRLAFKCDYAGVSYWRDILKEALPRFQKMLHVNRFKS